MESKTLKNKPLVEAMFELRWALQESTPDTKKDPHYKLLIGRFYDKMTEYPFHEELPTATIPDELAEYVVQHRFRIEKNKWPLIQIGPGILTVNDTANYTWTDFHQRISRTVNTLFEIYPQAETTLKINSVKLRYLDATQFDYQNNDILMFLKNELKTEINLQQNLFKDTGIEKQPNNLDIRLTFASSKPKGVIRIRFARGKRNLVDVLIWDTMVKSDTDDIPATKIEITNWANDAHTLTDDWFFKLVEGELLRSFE